MVFIEFSSKWIRLNSNLKAISKPNIACLSIPPSFYPINFYKATIRTFPLESPSLSSGYISISINFYPLAIRRACQKPSRSHPTFVINLATYSFLSWCISMKRATMEWGYMYLFWKTFYFKNQADHMKTQILNISPFKILSLSCKT